MLWHEGIAPLAGAWIETSVTFAYIPALMVVPARARAAILRVAIFASGSIGRFQSAFDSFLPARAIQRFQHCFPYPAAPDHLPSVSQCRFPWPCGSESRDGPSPLSARTMLLSAAFAAIVEASKPISSPLVSQWSDRRCRAPHRQSRPGWRRCGDELPSLRVPADFGH